MSSEIDDYKAQFASLNEFVIRHHGWITSVPGAVEVSFECLPDSTLPNAIRGLGYDVAATGEGERIMSHDGICRVLKFGLDLHPVKK